MKTLRGSSLSTSLGIAIDVMIAPAAACDRIAEQPNWVVPALAVGVLTAAGTALAFPADLHVVTLEANARFASDPSFAQMSGAQRSAMTAMMANIMHWNWLIASVFALLLVALQSGVLCLAVLVAHGRGRPQQYLSIVTNTALVGTGLAALLQGLIVNLRGADSFHSASDLMLALPSLAWAARGVHGPALDVLATLNPLALWATAIVALGLQRIAALPRVVAIVLSAVPCATAAILASLYAH